MPIIVQQDPTIYRLFIYVNRSKYFGWFLHPSSGAHATVSTAFGISKTVLLMPPAVTVLLMPHAVDTVAWAPDDGWRYRPKHLERFTDINYLYIVAFCWTIIDTYFTMRGPLNVKFLFNILPLILSYEGKLKSLAVARLALTLGTQWSWVVNARSRRFTPGVRSSGTHWMGGCVAPGSGWYVWREENIFPLPGTESQFVDCPSCSLVALPA